MKVNEFIQGRYIQAQVIYKYMQRHRHLFKGHTHKTGREIILDDTAIEILEKLYPKPVYTPEDYQSLEYKIALLEKDIAEKDLRIIYLEAELSKPWWKRLFKDKEKEITT